MGGERGLGEEGKGGGTCRRGEEETKEVGVGEEGTEVHVHAHVGWERGG